MASFMGFFLIFSAGKLQKGSIRTFWGIGGAQSKFNVVTIVGLGTKCKGFNESENICEDRESARVAAAVGCLELERFDVHKIAVEDFCNPDCAAEGANLAVFKYQEYKSKPKPLTELSFYPCGCCDVKAAEQKWNQGMVMADGQNVARTLADRPANKCTPTLFSNCIQALLSTHPTLKVEVHDKKWIEGMKMGAFLAVNAGSHEEPKMIEVTYTNTDPKCPPMVFIGKGVTFDTGGICLKPCKNMHLMRGDVAGGAIVAGAMHAIAYLGLKVNMKCLIPLTDNKPSGKATCPGDVVTAMNGKTIAVDNTDAEGRLLLADALCYSATFKPKMIVDVATLTWAIGAALGKGAAGIFSNNNKLLKVIEEAGARSGDRVWRMPLWEYFRKIVTDFDGYDINNTAVKDGGGCCTAAAFLSEFVPKDTCWMHLDIAGVDDPPQPMKYLEKSMSGRPTRTLIEFVMMNETKGNETPSIETQHA